MDLYDAIDEITAKQVTKTETGDMKVEGLMVGTVTKNYDMQFPGRVCVSVPTRDTPTNILLWARVITLYVGTAWGHYFLPEVGDEVVLGFEGGSIERPYVIGSIPKQNSTFVKKAADEGNNKKQIVTRAGNAIEILDTASPAGGGAPEPQDKIRIYTAKQEREVCLDNAKGRITIKDKNNENYVVIDTNQKCVTVRAGERLRVNVGNGIQFAMNDSGGNGDVSLTCKKLTVNATGKIQLNSQTGIGLKSASVKVEGQNVSLDSQGVINVKGQVVNLG